MSKNTGLSEPCRPFLKWAGNKFRIINEVHKLLPVEGNRLVEPFVGSAAVFLNTHYKHNLLCDNNPDLVNLYNTLKDEGNVFIKYCRRFFTEKNNQAENFYHLREQFNTSQDIRKRSALFVYLNRHCYNGLCRYNTNGRFNVPFGRYKQPYFPEKEMLAFHEKAQQATFQLAGFEQTMKNTKPGDIIYCDPPYVPLSPSANFTSYSASGFSLEEQQRLAELAQQTARRGIPVLISNHQTDFTDKIYQQAKQNHYFKVRRFISCAGKNRQYAGEVLALYK